MTAAQPAAVAMRPAIPAQLEATRLVVVLRRADPSALLKTVAALLSAGVTVIEVTLDSPSATGMIGSLCSNFGERLTVGAGTVMDTAEAELAVAAGARFIVSPHTDPNIIGAMAQLGVPSIPGAMTPTEVVLAWRSGASLVKLFPASSGGPRHVTDLRGPLRGIPLLPTGGVTLENAGAFMRAGAWGLGLGSALVLPGLVAANRFDELARRATECLTIIREARGTQV